jgi:hypothetical protein
MVAFHLQKAERESPGHCMPGMNRRPLKGGEERECSYPRLDGKRSSWYHSNICFAKKLNVSARIAQV